MEQAQGFGDSGGGGNKLPFLQMPANKRHFPLGLYSSPGFVSGKIVALANRDTSRCKIKSFESETR